jgi:hypothetical protein
MTRVLIAPGHQNFEAEYESVFQSRLCGVGLLFDDFGDGYGTSA